MEAAALRRVRSLADALAELDHLLVLAVEEAGREGVDRTALAAALGVHRSTLYRRHELPPVR